MELYERIAAVRKAKGLTQEQLGALLDVSRQAVSKWESGQTVPDALTIARLCEALQVSADYVLLGREPGETEMTEGAGAQYQLPDTCPCCGRTVTGTLCTVCGYPLPSHPPRGSRYAVVASSVKASIEEEEVIPQFTKYCGTSQEKGKQLYNGMKNFVPVVLRRGLTDDAVYWITRHMDRDTFQMRIVEDRGEAEEELVNKSTAMELPPSEKKSEGLGFWGVVGAVVVALLILSFF